jgi:hypothetical protein
MEYFVTLHNKVANTKICEETEGCLQFLYTSNRKPHEWKTELENTFVEKSFCCIFLSWQKVGNIDDHNTGSMRRTCILSVVCSPVYM